MRNKVRYAFDHSAEVLVPEDAAQYISWHSFNNDTSTSGLPPELADRVRGGRRVKTRRPVRWFAKA